MNWYLVHYVDGEDVLVRAANERYALQIADNFRLGRGKSTASTYLAHLPAMDLVWARLAEAMQRTHGPPNQQAGRPFAERGTDLWIDFGTESERVEGGQS